MLEALRYMGTPDIVQIQFQDPEVSNNQVDGYGCTSIIC